MFHVSNLSEAHLLSYGWMIYENLFTLLSLTGIVTIPFLWVLLNNIKDSVAQYGFLNPRAATNSFATIAPTFVVMLLVYTIAFIPSATLELDDMAFQSVCLDEESGNSVTGDAFTAGSSGTRFDELNLLAGSQTPNAAAVPIGFDLLMRLGAGISRAMNSSGVCSTGVTKLDKELSNMQVKDADLQRELGHFVTDCYFPAKARFEEAQRTNISGLLTIDDAKNTAQRIAIQYRDWRNNPPPDVESTEVHSRDNSPFYVGSQFFLETPGLYKAPQNHEREYYGHTLKASKPVKGFDYDPVNDCERSTTWCNSPVNPDYAENNGFPNCADWWNGVSGYEESTSLRTRLADASAESQLPWLGHASTFYAKMDNVTEKTLGSDKVKSQRWKEDKVIMAALLSDAALSSSIRAAVEEDQGRMTAGGPPPDVPPPIEGADGKNAGGWAILGTAIAGGAAVISAASTSVAGAGAVAMAGLQVASTAGEFYFIAWLVRESYPIAVSFLEMVLVIMLPFIMLGNAYDTRALYRLSLLFLAIQFLHPWRYIVEYLDENLFAMMFPRDSDWGMLMTTTVEKFLLDIVTTVMYTAVPVIVLWLAAIAGSENTSGASQMKNSADGAAAGAAKMSTGPLKLGTSTLGKSWSDQARSVTKKKQQK